MMRTILGLALFTAASLQATATDLPPGAMSWSGLPTLDAAAAEKSAGVVGGGGGGAGLPLGPPMLSGVGLGIQFGFPTSLTLKVGGAHDNGWAFGLGAGFGYERGFAPSLSLHGDYQLHLATLVRTGDLSLTAYVGPGLGLGLFGTGGYGFYNAGSYIPGSFGTFFALGVRCALGLSMAFSMAPVEIYLEATPAVFVFPVIAPALGGSLGFRYYF